MVDISLSNSVPFTPIVRKKSDMSQTIYGPKLDRSHIAPVTTREELIYLLTRAAELEHGLACIYLFAAYSLKNDVSEGVMTDEQAAMVRGWRRHLTSTAIEEMGHLAQVANLLTAIGGAPHFKRTNFPLPPSAYPFGIRLSLEPFSQETIERFVCYEMPETGILSKEQQALFDPTTLATGCGRDKAAFEPEHADRDPGGNGGPAGSGLPVCAVRWPAWRRGQSCRAESDGEWSRVQHPGLAQWPLPGDQRRTPAELARRAHPGAPADGPVPVRRLGHQAVLRWHPCPHRLHRQERA